MFPVFQAPSVELLRAPALVTQGHEFSWGDVIGEMDRFSAEVDELFSFRPLILLEASNEVGAVVAYLAALRAGWPIILVARGQADADGDIVRTYRPNLIVTVTSGRWCLRASDPEPVEMHPDLAVMLSTSGTTGAAKLVRLSRENLRSNATAIAEYLGVQGDDRAITALPFHYSYGMSVLNVQALCGGSLVLTEASVTEPVFWSLAAEARATSVAMVPTQFEMLDAARWSASAVPGLRYVTQAGGRLDPQLVRKFAAQAKQEGWRLFIMYGQTEAGPRMAYLPPEDALDHAGCIGRAIPGGQFKLIDQDGRDIEEIGCAGELVFEGPGVMLGYARSRDELREPAGPPQLMTGDIAERLESGYFRILGRSARFLKLHGLRIGLDEVEASLRDAGHKAYAVGTDQSGLTLFLLDRSQGAAEALAREVSQRYGLPQMLVNGLALETVPVLASGKVDYQALAKRASKAPRPVQQDTLSLLRQILRDRDPDLSLSFRESGGDSLGFLTVQLHFSESGVQLPDGWEDVPLSDIVALEMSAPSQARGLAWHLVLVQLNADVLMRVFAALAVIALHATEWPSGGGAYLLTVLIGYSLARFQFAPLSRGKIMRMLVTMLLPILTIYYVLITGTALLRRPLPPEMFLLTANFGHDLADPEPYWFVSAYVQVILLVAIIFSVRPARNFIFARPFLAGVVAIGVAASVVFLLGLDQASFTDRFRHPAGAFELVTFGWCAWFARTWAQRLLVTGLMILIWTLEWRDLPVGPVMFCMLGLQAVLWRVRMPVPRALFQVLTWIGSLALYIYLCHPIAISLVVRKLPPVSDGVAFICVTLGSIVLAYATKRSYDFVLARVMRGIEMLRQRQAESATLS